MQSAQIVCGFVFLLVLVQKSSGQGCNICNTVNGFACMSRTQYVKCDNFGNVLDWSVTTCGAGSFCNNQFISPAAVDPCVKVAQNLAICQTAPIANPIDPSAFCASRRIARYSYSTGCKQYINCYLNNGRKGAIFTCPGVTLFDDTLGACVSDPAFVCPV